MMCHEYKVIRIVDTIFGMAMI